MAIGPILGQKKHVYYMKEGVLYVHYDKGGGGFQIISFVAPSFLKYNYCNTIYLLAQFWDRHKPNGTIQFHTK